MREIAVRLRQSGDAEAMPGQGLPGFAQGYAAASGEASTLAGNKLQLPINLPLEKGEVKKVKNEILNQVQDDYIKKTWIPFITKWN